MVRVRVTDGCLRIRVRVRVRIRVRERVRVTDGCLKHGAVMVTVTVSQGAGY